jgi:hypothetical protein
MTAPASAGAALHPRNRGCLWAIDPNGALPPRPRNGRGNLTLTKEDDMRTTTTTRAGDYSGSCIDPLG